MPCAGSCRPPAGFAHVLHGQQHRQPRKAHCQLQRDRLPDVRCQVPRRLQAAAVARHVEAQQQLDLREGVEGIYLQKISFLYPCNPWTCAYGTAL